MKNASLHDPEYLDRKALDTELVRVFEKCHDCRRCLPLCPSFPSLFDAIDSHDLEAAKLTAPEIREVIDQISDTDVTVLIQGESGVGKEIVARAVHAHSTRVARPFVKVNCAALPEDLLESELFGYEKGAFTGAGARKFGKF